MTPDEHEIEQSFRYRLGDLLVRTARSPLTVFLLPVRLFRLVQHARRRSSSLKAVAHLECGLGLAGMRDAAAAQPASLQVSRAILSDRLPDLPADVPAWVREACGLIEDYRKAPAPLRGGRGQSEGKPGRLASVLHSALPSRTNGYGARSHALILALQGEAWEVTPLVRNQDAAEIDYDGITYRSLGQAYAGEGLWTYLDRLASAIAQEARSENVQMLHAASNFICGYAGLKAARELGVPFVYEVRGLWHVTRASHEPGFDQSLSYALQERMEIAVAQEADALVTLNTPLLEYFVARGVDRAKVSVVPNGVDPDAFRFSRDVLDATRRAHGLDDRKIIGFCGSLTPYEGLDFLICALRPLLKMREDVVLLVVGDGPARAALEARIAEFGLSGQVRFTGKVAPEEARRLTALFDIAPFPRPTTAVNRLVTPVKPLEAIASGAHVLLSDVPPLAELVEPGMAAPLDPTDAQAWRNAVEAALERPQSGVSNTEAITRWEDSGRRLGQALVSVQAAPLAAIKVDSQQGSDSE